MRPYLHEPWEGSYTLLTQRHEIGCRIQQSQETSIQIFQDSRYLLEMLDICQMLVEEMGTAVLGDVIFCHEACLSSVPDIGDVIRHTNASPSVSDQDHHLTIKPLQQGSWRRCKGCCPAKLTALQSLSRTMVVGRGSLGLAQPQKLKACLVCCLHRKTA